MASAIRCLNNIVATVAVAAVVVVAVLLVVLVVVVAAGGWRLSVINNQQAPSMHHSQTTVVTVFRKEHQHSGAGLDRLVIPEDHEQVLCQGRSKCPPRGVDGRSWWAAPCRNKAKPRDPTASLHMPQSLKESTRSWRTGRSSRTPPCSAP